MTYSTFFKKQNSKSEIQGMEKGELSSQDRKDGVKRYGDMLDLFWQRLDKAQLQAAYFS